MVIIGGGELIREAGKPLYDVYRVPGRHILSTVGVLNGQDTDYLSEYRAVSVRSHADRDRLGRGQVVPCLTLLYKDYLPSSVSPIEIPDGAIGIHLNISMYKYVPEFLRWLQSSIQYPLVWLPITYYNGDDIFLKKLSDEFPNSVFIGRNSPDAVFATIGNLSALVTMSLHGMLFAYAQGIPILGYTGIGKIASFLEERNLVDTHGFQTANDIKRKLPTLLSKPTDTYLSSLIKADKAKCQEWVEIIVQEATFSLSSPLQTIVLNPIDPKLHTQVMDDYSETAQLTTQLIEKLVSLNWILSNSLLARFYMGLIRLVKRIQNLRSKKLG